MKSKIIAMSVIAIMLIIGSCIHIYADDTVITLDENARKFSNVNRDVDFRDMEPGEERIGIITIFNSSNSDMDFYISGEVLDNIADNASSDKNAVYELKLYKDAQTVPFFNGIIGSRENKELGNDNLGLAYLKDDTIIASLKKGEKTEIKLSIVLDGDSTENVYMNKNGKVRLNISTSQSVSVTESSIPTENIIKRVKKIVTVQTGDNNYICIYIGLAVFAAVVIMALASKIGKKRNLSELKNNNQSRKNVK